MNIKNECENINTNENSITKLHGKTTIELFDANTGELVHEKVEENMVTNFFQGPFSHEICGTYTNQPTDLFSLVKGVQLLNHQEDENEHNVDLEISGSAVTGFGNQGVNSAQTNTKFMSMNQLETGKTTNGYKWVWNANENQCNGPIECVSLITKDLNTSTFAGNSSTTSTTITNMYSPNMMAMFLGKWCDTPGNQSNATFSNNTFSNIVHIDWENEIMYDIERNYDNDKKITIKRYNMNRDKINLRYRMKPILIDEHEITFANSLNYDYGTSTIHARPFSAKIESNILYLVKSGATTFSSTTNLLRIIKINLSDYTFTDEVKTLTQTFVDAYRGQINSADKSRNFHFIKDFHPIKDGYVYLHSTTADHSIYKVNLNDVSDITIIDASGFTAAQTEYTILNLVTDKNIFFYQRRPTSGTYSNYAVGLSLDDNKVAYMTINGSMYSPSSSNGFYSTSNPINWRNVSHVFADVTDGVLTMVHYISYGSSNLYDGTIYIDQYSWDSCKVTINNVTPVVKTSDRTMKITYELSEVTE